MRGALFQNLSDDEVVELVERYPMHVQEIDLVARQASITAKPNGFAKVEISDLIVITKRLRGVRCKYCFKRNEISVRY